MAAATMVLRPLMAAASPWDGFQIIEWQPRTAPAYQALAGIGVTAASVIADREAPGRDLDARLRPVEAAGLGYFVENIATDFYAPYHRFVPGRAVNALYDATIARWRADAADASVFERSPSLSDPVWRDRIVARLRATVQAHRAHHPLYYNLGDETGIADLSAAWDFDYSPASLAGFRAWLPTRYASIAELDREWDAGFADWSEVMPETTFAAMRRGDDNFAAWADFKSWMDASFADAVGMGTQAIHDADPDGLAAIEGAQRPGPGGYDYARLAGRVDAMEIYPDDVNLEIAQDLRDPGQPPLHVLTTSFAADPAARLEVWRSLLRGGDGLVLWDEAHQLAGDDGTIGTMGRAMAPLFANLRGDAGRLLTASAPELAPVAILYSQDSFRAQWMLDQRPRGDAWVDRGADGENDDTAWREALRIAATSLLQIGIRPRWVSPGWLEAGIDPAIRVLILPHTVSMSETAWRAVDRFAQRGGLVVADVVPGAFDEHLRRRRGFAAPSWASIDRALWTGPVGPRVAGWEKLLSGQQILAPVVLRDAHGQPVDGIELRLHHAADADIVSVIRAKNAPPFADPPELLLASRDPARRLVALAGPIPAGPTQIVRGAQAQFTLDSDCPSLFRLTR